MDEQQQTLIRGAKQGNKDAAVKALRNVQRSKGDLVSAVNDFVLPSLSDKEVKSLAETCAAEAYRRQGVNYVTSDQVRGKQDPKKRKTRFIPIEGLIDHYDFETEEDGRSEEKERCQDVIYDVIDDGMYAFDELMDGDLQLLQDLTPLARPIKALSEVFPEDVFAVSVFNGTVEFYAVVEETDEEYEIRQEKNKKAKETRDKKNAAKIAKKKAAEERKEKKMLKELIAKYGNDGV
jgi:hypothetical protein